MHFCCICAQKLDKIVPLTNTDDSGIDYLSKLRLCVSQEIWKEYYHICTACTSHLDAAYNFVQICIKSALFRCQNLLKDKTHSRGEEKDSKNALEKEKKESFYCFKCSKGYKQKARLIAHIRKYHSKIRKKEDESKADKKRNEVKLEKDTVMNDSQDIKEGIKIENDLSEFSKGIEKIELIIEDDLNIDNIGFTSESQTEDEQKNTQKISRKERKSVKCELCGEIFKTKNLWRAHVKQNHKSFKPYACDQCDSQYLNAYSLLIHKRKHSNEKPFICSTCGKTFISSADLNHHYKIHNIDRSYVCQICNKSYKTHSNLRTHRIQVHLDYKDWEYECKICQKKFPIRGNLIKHMKRHEGVKNFSCHICPKKFVNKAELSIHLNTHTDERNFKCKICLKAYKNREGLRRHMKVVHDLGNWKPTKPEKKYQCPLCPKMFPFTNKLQRHIYSHTGERPFVCDFCPKRFVDTYGRKVHMKKEHPMERIKEDSF